MPEAQRSVAFDPLSLPLHGRRLIEASAGTGKTWNIANLYLRMLLGHGLERPLEVERILVVTFTRAATAELHGRIRERVEEALELFSANDLPGGADPFIAALRECMDEPRRRRARRDLRVALECLDDAAIHTIDGFAVRCMQAFLFESGALADVEVDESSGTRDGAILRDAYRRFTGGGDPEREGFLAQAGLHTLDRFLALGRAAGRADAEIRVPGGDAPPDLEELIEEDRSTARRLAAAHAALAAEWAQLKRQAGAAAKDWQERLNGEITADGVRFTACHLVKWLDRQLGAPGANYGKRPVKPPAYLQAWLGLDPGDGDGELFDLVVRFRDQYVAAMERQETLGDRARAALLSQLRRERARVDLDRLGLDDVKRLLNDRLADPGAGERLRRALTLRHPVCLVDEFQDTDPAQFELFNRLYGEAAAGGSAGRRTGLFMIGDPKQSIYGFRGADIFSYLRVRSEVRAEEAPEHPAIVTLGTNWRSTRELVQLVNELFDEPAGSGRPAFLFPDIAHEPVQASEDRPGVRARDRLVLPENSALSAAPLVFVGHAAAEGEDPGFPAQRRACARDAAQRIAALLDPQSPARLGDGETDRVVRARDVAVLVSNRTEAGVMRTALARVGIDSVFLSQRDSVFQTAEPAADLLQILRAMHDPGDPGLLRAALATPLLRGYRPDFEELDRLDEDETRFEALVEEFAAYREAWLGNGVLSALNRLARNRRLLERIARLPDSERTVTDLRHLGDLLQERDLETASPEEVIDWYARQLENDEAVDEDRKRIRLESDEGLVKIVTIHVSKGLQYPLVFLPFFFMHRPPDSDELPLFHDPDAAYASVIDFAADAAAVREHREREALAERLRLLYVAVTRAESQCVVGIAAASYGRRPCWSRTAWAHLLGLETEAPTWAEISEAIARRLPCGHFALAERGDCPAGPMSAHGGDDAGPVLQELIFEERHGPDSWWQVTSFSRLAHAGEGAVDAGTGWGEKADDDRERQPGADGPDALETPAAPEPAAAVAPGDVRPDDAAWRSDVRYRLRGSARTGNCLHEVLERRLREPSPTLGRLVDECFTRYGLDHPPAGGARREDDEAERRRQWLGQVTAWLDAVLRQPLPIDGGVVLPALADLFDGGQAVPELLFDFAIGADEQPVDAAALERALARAGLAPLRLPGPQLHGLMTGAIDLTFVHDGAAYLLDYKSNTLGPAPRFYDGAGMDRAMREARYDLQYLIYATAVHRHFRERLGDGYAYDESPGALRFGGVIYLFLRGMGIGDPSCASHGVWFHRPERNAVEALDRAFAGLAGGAPA